MSNINTQYLPNGTVQFRLIDLLSCMSRDDKLALAEELACDDEILQHVVDQITEYGTVNNSRGSSLCIAKSEGDKERPLDRARRQIARSADIIAGETIDRLERTIRFYEEQEERRRKEAEEQFWAVRQS